MSDNVVPLRMPPKTAQELLAELVADKRIKSVMVSVQYQDDGADVFWSHMSTRDLTYLATCLQMEVLGWVGGGR